MNLEQLSKTNFVFVHLPLFATSQAISKNHWFLAAALIPPSSIKSEYSGSMLFKVLAKEPLLIREKDMIPGLSAPE